MQDRSLPGHAICHIGPLALVPESEVLLRDGVPLPLGRRAVALLLRLVQSAGEIVSKADLYETVWRGQTVEESNLTVQISLLRRTLAAEAGGGGWIQTLARRGYRFTGPVSWQAAATAQPPTLGLPIAASPPFAQAMSDAPSVALISNVPFAVPLHFMGRINELAALHVELTSTRRRPAIVALHGLRGVGKTILAAAYARQHEAAHRATWWLRAQTVTTLRADLAALAVRLGWVRPDAAEKAACLAAVDGLQRDGAGILLIYDNAIDAAGLLSYLPKAGACSIIVTSNARAWRTLAVPLEISLWSATVGADYLIARTGRSERRNDAETLSTALGGLPLAHEQAAAYVEYLELDFADYLRRLAAAPARLLSDASHAPAGYHGGLPVAKAFQLAIEQAATIDPHTTLLLQYAAVLAPEPIPVFLFREGHTAFEGPLAGALVDDGLDTVLAALRAFALISRETVPDERDATLRTDCVRLHRLVRQVVTATLTPEAAARIRADLIGALAAVYPKALFNVPSTWPRVRRLDALALPLVTFPAIIPEGAELAACLVLDGLASFRHGALAAFSQARALFERELSLAEATFGPAHPVTGLALNNLALLLRDYGDPKAAHPLYVRALAVREAALGADHPDTAVCLNNLANAMVELNDPLPAHALFERALGIWRSTLGETHWQTARGLNNLARSFHRRGDLACARVLHGQALTLRENILGPNHPDTANSLKNFALLKLDFGDTGEARALSERALAINDAFFGPDHPETAATLATLASIVLAQGDPAEALLIAERALTTLSSTLSPGAPSTQSAAVVAANCLDALGCTEAAAEMRTRHSLSRPGLALKTD